MEVIRLLFKIISIISIVFIVGGLLLLIVAPMVYPSVIQIFGPNFGMGLGFIMAMIAFPVMILSTSFYLFIDDRVKNRKVQDPL